MPTVEKYPWTKCAIKAVREYYPTATEARRFRRDMQMLQAELIRCHYAEMDTPTRERALSTLDWLEREMGSFYQARPGQ